MIIGRFQVECRPEHTEEMAAAIAAVREPSLRLPGVVHFDVARSLTDPNVLFAFEVFENREALDRQNAQPEVATVLRLADAGALRTDYAWTVWEGAAD